MLYVDREMDRGVERKVQMGMWFEERRGKGIDVSIHDDADDIYLCPKSLIATARFMALAKKPPNGAPKEAKAARLFIYRWRHGLTGVGELHWKRV